MKHILNIFICGLALCLAVSVGAVPAPVSNAVQAAVDKADPLDKYHTFKVPIAHQVQSADSLQARGYDHSNDYQEWATVEVWTGGNSRKPINYGHLRDLRPLDNACPRTDGGHKCKDLGWLEFWTKTLVKGSPLTTDTRKAYVKVNGARWATEGGRTFMLQIVADTLRAFTKHDKDYNCYSVAEFPDDIFCNVPKLIKVNLPTTCEPLPSFPIHGSESKREARGLGRLEEDEEGRVCSTRSNFRHVQTFSADEKTEFSPWGDLRPCKTRNEVDAVMDKYLKDIMREFPDEKKFTRNALVIINGDRTLLLVRHDGLRIVHDWFLYG